MVSYNLAHYFRRTRFMLLPSRWAWYFVALWIFVAIFSDFIANDRPITCVIAAERRWPICRKVAEQFGWMPYDAMLRNFDFSTSEHAYWPPIRYAYNTYDAIRGTAAPDAQHLLGTHDLGRDVAAGIVAGSRTALIIGVTSMFLAAFVGLLLGGFAGMSRPSTGFWRIFSADAVVLRLLEVYQSVPKLLILLVLAGLIERVTVWHISIVIASLEWPLFAQYIRAELRRVQTLDYIESANALGFSRLHIFWRHALPNALGSTLVAAAFAVSNAVLLESSLSFLGIGLPPDQVSWGSILGQIRSSPSSWWLALYPGLALFGVTASIFAIGQQLKRKQK